MTIQTLGIGKTAYPDLSYAAAPDRALDKARLDIEDSLPKQRSDHEIR